jgi:hypothetical protein
MPNEFPYDVFLSHSAKDKAVVRVPSAMLTFPSYFRREREEQPCHPRVRKHWGHVSSFGQFVFDECQPLRRGGVQEQLPTKARDGFADWITMSVSPSMQREIG